MKASKSASDDRNYFALGLKHKYLYFRRTRIIATIGPSSSSPEMIRELILKGLNVARINFSHGKAEDHLHTIQTIRKISTQLRMPVAIIGDLCGPKIRVGSFRENAVMLKTNSLVTITVDPVIGNETLIPCQYKKLISEVSVHDQILLDDGNLELKVTAKIKGTLRARVVRGGLLKDNKGMNLPDTKMHIPALTAKDRADVAWCIKGEVDYIALSFVRKAKDVLELKDLLRRRKADIPVIAKIEKPEALQHIHEIISAADGIMIARGDLGVELPAKKVPFIQDKLIETCIGLRKPVIVATQMLESMIEHSRPTRAEVTDVSAACLSGVDAVMLSGETAAGKFPVEALETMDAILRETESYRFFARGGLFRDPVLRETKGVEEAVGSSISQLSRDLMVRCIVVVTRSGRTASVVSADRPSAPILVLTQSERVLLRLQLLWGVVPLLVSSKLAVDRRMAFAEAYMKGLKLASSGDYMLMVRGIGDMRADTQSITIHRMS